VKTILALIISAIACVALGVKLDQLRESISPDASFPADEAPADSARGRSGNCPPPRGGNSACKMIDGEGQPSLACARSRA